LLRRVARDDSQCCASAVDFDGHQSIGDSVDFGDVLTESLTNSDAVAVLLLAAAAVVEPEAFSNLDGLATGPLDFLDTRDVDALSMDGVG